MKGFVLAAGLGTRLRPYTDVIPKPMFPVLGVPLLHWVLRGLKLAGVRDVIVNLHHLPDAIVSNLGDGAACGMNISYQLESTILGTGGALAAAATSFLRDEACFLLHNGDIFTDWDLGGLVSAGCGRPVLGVVDGPGLAEGDKRVELGRDGRVVSLRGQPKAGDGRRVVYGGVSLLNQEVVDLLTASAAVGSLDAPVFREACLVADALIPMLKSGHTVASVGFSDRWYCDIGTPESYLDLNMRALADPAALMATRGFEPPRQIEPGVFVCGNCHIGKGVRFVPPVMMCDGSEIGAGALVGAGVVSSGRIASGARVERAVVMSGAVAVGVVSGIVMPGVN